MRLPIASAALLSIVLAACSDAGERGAFSQQDPVEPAFSAGSNGRGDSGNRYIAMLDDCDPSDPSWSATGGCALRNGDVRNAEFGMLLSSPHSTAVVGHPAWRNEPSYLKIDEGQDVRVANEGGRVHTLTRVAQFGGGRVPPLNMGLTPAPECQPGAGAVDVLPGGRSEFENLAIGIHRFQCCIHPWMRALIKVQPH